MAKRYLTPNIDALTREICGCADGEDIPKNIYDYVAEKQYENDFENRPKLNKPQIEEFIKEAKAQGSKPEKPAPKPKAPKKKKAAAAPAAVEPTPKPEPEPTPKPEPEPTPEG